MVSVTSIGLALAAAAPAALAQFIGGGIAGSQSVSSGSYYNSQSTSSYGYPGYGYGGMGYGGMGYGGMGYGGMGYGGLGYGGLGYGGMGYGGLGYGGMGYGYGRGVGIHGAYTGGAAIMGPSGSIVVGPQSAGGIYL
ncbi:hypothetical protein IWW50_002468 [Coemansia erecta]|nr:hypothetical protein GGF43_006399 [Coemansia sp. RSA 2618]KAJ2826231.1 hypothetical protein IWW50_002468 [Coemansia erecta]